MTPKILFVDDEKNVLEAIKRQLRKKFQISCACGAEAGLQLLREQGPFSVVVSDLRMPEMDGIEFLSRVRQMNPDTVRMMLTGNADLQSAIQAVNEGNVFQFLTKPCRQTTLESVLEQGIRQYGLVTAERELLDKTLKGSINLLAEMLSLVNPEAFGRAARISRYAKQIVTALGISGGWHIETAILLSQIGCVVLPENAIKKLYLGQTLDGEESQIFDMHPSVAANLISHIPRMEKVAKTIAYQEKHFDGSGNPRDELKGEDIPLGGRILKVALDFELLTAKGMPKGNALLRLKKRSGGWYDPAVLSALEASVGIEAKFEVKAVAVGDLEPNMVLSQDIQTADGRLLIAKGQEVSALMIERLKNFAKTAGIVTTIRVYVPIRIEA